MRKNKETFTCSSLRKDDFEYHPFVVKVQVGRSAWGRHEGYLFHVPKMALEDALMRT